MFVCCVHNKTVFNREEIAVAIHVGGQMETLDFLFN